MSLRIGKREKDHVLDALPDIAMTVSVSPMFFFQVMSGMTGYDQAATYPAPQYGYEPDPRHVSASFSVTNLRF